MKKSSGMEWVRAANSTLASRPHQFPVDHPPVVGLPRWRTRPVLHPTHPVRSIVVGVPFECPGVVRTRQIVVGECGQIEYVVVAISYAPSSRRLVERVPTEVVRPGEDHLLGIGREICLPTYRAVTLGDRFVPAHTDVDVGVAQVPKPCLLCGQLTQHAHQLAGVQRGQAGLKQWSARFVIQRREQFKLSRRNGQHSVTVPGYVPPTAFVLDPGNWPTRVVLQASVHSGRVEEVRDMSERNTAVAPAARHARAAGRPVDIDTELGVVINLGEQLAFVDELKVAAQSRV